MSDEERQAEQLARYLEGEESAIAPADAEVAELLRGDAGEAPPPPLPSTLLT